MTTTSSWGSRERARQAAWLRQCGIELGVGERTSTIEDNVRFLTAAGRAELARGGGGELRARRGGLPGKLSSPWSSSALAANVFDYWRDKDLDHVIQALEANRALRTIALERPFPTGFASARASLDVVMTDDSDGLVAIESKFLEPFGSSKTGSPKKNLRPVYLDAARLPGWHQLHALRDLGLRIADGRQVFRRLDVPQLLKHAIALRAHGGVFELVLLWYAPPDGLEEACQMKDEIERFTAAALADGLRFRALTYQQVFSRLRETATGHTDYLDYLHDRYFDVTTSPADCRSGGRL